MAGKKVVLVGDLGTDHEGFPPTPVISGSPNVLMDGKPVARVGDPLAIHSKPKHSPHPRAVAAGEPTVLINGIPVAITGGAITCGGVTIGSGSGVAGGSSGSSGFSGLASAAIASSRALSSANVTGNTAHARAGAVSDQTSLSAASIVSNPDTKLRSELAAKAALAAPAKMEPDEAIEKPSHKIPEPAFHVVTEPMSKTALLQTLYGDVSAKPDHFDRLNPQLGSRVLPGEMVVLGDPEGTACTQEEADLMQIARQVNQQVHALNEEEAQFLTDHYDLLEMMTSNAATGLGAGAVMISRQIAGIESTLRDLESLHQTTYSKHGHLNSPDFFAKRRELFKQLDFALGKIARKGMSLDDSPKLKSALGLSSKSIVHNWNQAGVGGIPGYATHYDKLATGARYARFGGYLAIGLDASVSAMKIKDVCLTGTDRECEKIKYTETGRLGGSMVGGGIGATIGPVGCVFIGIGTAGYGGIACAILLSGAGSVAGGALGGGGGEALGNAIYEVVPNE